MKLTYIMPLLASLTIATQMPKESEFNNSLSESSVSTVITPTRLTGAVAPSLVVRKPLLNIDPSILKVVAGDSIMTTLVSKVAASASEPTKMATITPAITDSSSAVVPTLVEREPRSPEDKVKKKTILCFFVPPLPP